VKNDYIHLGILQKNYGLNDKAHAIFLHVLTIDPYFTKAKFELTELGVLYNQTKQQELAYKTFLTVLEVDKTYWNAKI
jgi:lipoprotein NlpI